MRERERESEREFKETEKKGIVGNKTKNCRTTQREREKREKKSSQGISDAVFNSLFLGGAFQAKGTEYYIHIVYSMIVSYSSR